jgi:DNA-binding LacI/PurR family transcriptional regulator
MPRRKLSVKSPPPSLATVARAAGVSTASVSLVLGGRHKDYGLSSETAERIRSVAAQQGYQRPSRRRGPPRLHVVHFEDLVRMEERGLGASVLQPLMDALAARGWLASVDTRLPAVAGGDLLSASAVVVPVNHGFDEAAGRLVRSAAASGVQPVVLGRIGDRFAGIQVDGDQFGGGRLAAEFLLGQGHRQIGLVGGIAGDPHSEARLAGFLGTAARTAKAELWGDGGFTIAAAHRLVAARLAGGARPTAIFCASDRMALGTLLALREAGLAVPKDVSLVGFDDQAEFAQVAPGLSTIRLVSEDIGTRIAALLEPSSPLKSERLQMTARLMVRGSTSAPRTSP